MDVTLINRIYAVTDPVELNAIIAHCQAQLKNLSYSSGVTKVGTIVSITGGSTKSKWFMRSGPVKRQTKNPQKVVVTTELGDVIVPISMLSVVK